jgi:hypothetical protein
VCYLCLLKLSVVRPVGCQGGVGAGNVTKAGAGGGGGHGGKGGSGVSGGLVSNGGSSYGSNDLPCELGSGGGNPGNGSSPAGGGLIGELQTPHEKFHLNHLVM